MAFVRKFLVELVLVALLVGWAVTKFPDVMAPAIPWLFVAVFWHLAWEVTPHKWFNTFTKRRTRVLYVAAFVVGGLLSTLIVYGARREIAAFTSAEHSKEPQVPQPTAKLKIEARYDTYFHSGKDEHGFTWSSDDVAALALIANTSEGPLENVVLNIKVPDDVAIRFGEEMNHVPNVKVGLPSSPGWTGVMETPGTVQESPYPAEITLSNTLVVRCRFFDVGQTLAIRMATIHHRMDSMSDAAEPGKLYPGSLMIQGIADVRTSAGLQRVKVAPQIYTTTTSRKP